MSTTSHVVEIKFVVTNAQAITKPLTDINKGTTDLSKSTTDLNKTTKETTNVYSQAQKSGAGYFKETTNLGKSTKALVPDTSKLNSETSALVGTHDKVAASQNKAGASMGGLTEKFQKFRPLIFGATGIVTAGIEAVGMWAMYSSASEKVAAAQAEVNTLMKAGQQDTQAMKDAQSELADAQRSQNFALRIMILSFSDLAPMILLSVNAVLNMKKAMAEGKAATDAMAASTNTLATAKKGALIPAVTDFNKIFAETPILTKNATTGFAGMDVELKKHPKTLSSVKTMYASFFTDLGSRLKSIGSAFLHPRTAMAAFGATMVSGLKTIGTALATAGRAVAAFSKAMLAAFLSNPILLAIAAISTALGVLIFDFGGVRTALMNFGKQLGDTYPALKIILEPLGQIGKGLEWLGSQINNVLGLGKATEETGNKAETAAGQFDAQYEAQKKVFDLSRDNALEVLQGHLDNVTKHLQAMGVEVKGNAQLLNTELKNAFNSLQKPTAEQSKLWQEITGHLQTAQKEGHLVGITQDELKAKVEALIGSMTNQVQTQAESELQMHNAGIAAEKNAGFLELVNIKVDQLTEAQKKNTGEMSTSQDVVAKWVVEHNKGIKVNEQQAQSLKEAGLVVLLYGKNIAFAKDNTIDWGKTMQNMAKSNTVLKESSTDTWNSIELLLKNNIITVKQAEEWIKILGEQGVVNFEQMKEKLDAYTKSLEDTKSPLEGFFKQQQEIGLEVQEGAQKLLDEADSLGILADTVGMTTEQIQQAIEIKKAENKEHDKTITSLQQLAIARGADLNVVKMSIPELSQFIQTHKLSAVTSDEVAAATAELIASRQEDRKAMEIEEAAARALLETTKEGIPVTEMTGEGLTNLIDIYTDTANATRLAADEVGLWYAELKQGEAQETATIEQLDKLATSLGVTIPDSIRQEGIPAMKEHMEAMLGIGEGAKKMAEEAKKAFNDMASEGQKAINDMIKEDVLAGKGKKVQKTLEEIGLSVDTLAGKQAIIEVGANTVDFEDKISSIPELVISMLQGIPPRTTVEADAIITAFADSMEQELGGRIPGIGDTINGLWQQVKLDNPKATAAQLVTIFQNEILKDPAKFAEAANKGIIDPTTGALQTGFAGMTGITDKSMEEMVASIFGKEGQFQEAGSVIAEAGATGFESGGHKFKTAGEKAWYELIKSTDPVRAEAYAAGKAVPDNVASGINDNTSVVTDAAGNIVTESGIQMKGIGSEATTATAPVPGIFSQAFLDASTKAGTQLQTMVTTIHEKMSNMSTSVDTYSTSMNVNFVTAIKNMGIPLLPFGEAIYALQGRLSEFSTSVATYSTSMASNFTIFANGVILEAQRIGLEAIVPLNEAFTLFSSNLIDTILPSINEAMLNWSTLTIQEFTRAATEGMIPYADGFTLLEQGILDLTTKMGEYMTNWADLTIEEFARADKEGIKVYQAASSTLSTTVAAHTKSMASNTEIFSSAAIGSYGTAVKSGLLTYQKASSTLSTTVATHSKSMAANLKSFSSQAVSALNAVTSAANKATSALNKMAAAAKKAASAAKGVGGGQFGASYLMQEGGQFMMRNGGSFIADHFMRYGGHSIGEYGKKELVTVTPLSDPSNLSQKAPFMDTQGINNFSNQMPTPQLAVPTNGQITQGGNNNSQPLNIQVRGDIKQEFMLPSGHVYRKQISSVLFENISAITSR